MFRLLPIALAFLMTPLRLQADRIRLDMIFDSKRGAIDIIDSERVGRNSDYQMRLGSQWENLARYWITRFNIDVAKRNYSHFLIRDEDGRETPLSETFDKVEYSSTVGATYQKSRNSFDISLAKSLGDTPFPFWAGSLAYDKTFANKTRVLGLAISTIDKKRPLSTYIDLKTFQQKRKPTEIQTLRGSVRWSEVFTDWWKAEMIASYGTTSARPDHYGLEIKNGFGLTHEILLKTHAGFIQETDGELRDDRGLFDVLWAESSLWWELESDYSLEAVYGYVVEREKYPLGRGDTILGSDSYGLKFNYEGIGWLVNLAWVFRNTNIHYQSHEIQGGLQWDI